MSLVSPINGLMNQKAARCYKHLVPTARKTTK